MDREGIPLEIQKRALQNLGLDPNEFNDVTQKRRERPQTPTERREIYKSIIRDWTFNQFQPLLETLQRGTPLTQYSPELQSIINHDIHSVLDETDPLYQKTYRELIGEIPPGTSPSSTIKLIPNTTNLYPAIHEPHHPTKPTPIIL